MLLNGLQRSLGEKAIGGYLLSGGRGRLNKISCHQCHVPFIDKMQSILWTAASGSDGVSTDGISTPTLPTGILQALGGSKPKSAHRWTEQLR